MSTEELSSAPQTQQRFCRECNKMMPIEKFAPHRPGKQCIDHFREMRRRVVLGTPLKRMFNSLRCRCYQDMRLFNQKTMAITLERVRELLTPQQMESYSNYCIIPNDPSLPLSHDNSTAVTSYQRRYIVGCWKKDPAAYGGALQLMLSAS
jgi:hypothetical protein